MDKFSYRSYISQQQRVVLTPKSLQNAYQYMSSWSWDLGWGGNPWTGSKCQSNFWRGQFDLQGMDVIDAAMAANDRGFPAGT